LGCGAINRNRSNGVDASHVWVLMLSIASFDPATWKLLSADSNQGSDLCQPASDFNRGILTVRRRQLGHDWVAFFPQRKIDAQALDSFLYWPVTRCAWGRFIFHLFLYIFIGLLGAKSTGKSTGKSTDKSTKSPEALGR
jgi:hypothetical protein